MDKIWTDDSWEQYQFWQNQDKKFIKKLNKLLTDIDRLISTLGRKT